MFNMFNTDSAFPSTVYIDHNMKIHYKEAGYSASFTNFANSIIEEMVFNMENSLIMSSVFDREITIGDSDNIINPGETIELSIEISITRLMQIQTILLFHYMMMVHTI